MQEITFLDLIVGLIITWAVALIFPLLIRYAVLKRPLKKKHATWTVIGLFFLNFAIFSGISNGENVNPVALLIIAFVSFYILRKGHMNNKKKQNVQQEKEEV